MIQGLWIPRIYTDKYGNEYPLCKFDLKPAFDQGVRFVIGEMANGPGKHNPNWPAIVQASYDAKIPVTIGVWEVDIPA